jgi:hypothetical protein
MRFTPRKEEYKAVVDMLESDEYDNADQMAKALVKAVADMLWQRDWQAVTLGFDGKAAWSYGPFSSESEADKFAQSCLGLGNNVQYRKTLLASPARVVGHLFGAPGVKGFCKTCGHSPFDHGTDGSSRGKCFLPECECAKWAEIK